MLTLRAPQRLPQPFCQSHPALSLGRGKGRVYDAQESSGGRHLSEKSQLGRWTWGITNMEAEFQGLRRGRTKSWPYPWSWRSPAPGTDVGRALSNSEMALQGDSQLVLVSQRGPRLLQGTSHCHRHLESSRQHSQVTKERFPYTCVTGMQWDALLHVACRILLGMSFLAWL